MALFITTFFGALWGMVGAFALSGAVSLLAGVLVGTVTVVLLLGSTRLLRLSRRLPVAAGGVGTNPLRTGSYRLAVLFEVIAIPISAVVLNNAGFPGAVVSAVAVIVGLHFFGLVSAFRSWRFAAVGGAMVLVGALSLLLPAGPKGGGASPRGALVGLGCALVLWLGVLPPLVSNWRRVGGRSG